MGGAHGTYGEENRCVQDNGWGNLRERDHLEDKGVDGKPLKWIFNIQDGVSGLDYLAQDRHTQRGPVNTVMKVRLPRKAGNLPEEVSAS